MDNDCSIRNKFSQNVQLVNEFNSIKCVNTKLFNELKEKECCLAKKQDELCILNGNISRLQKDLDNLNCLNQRTKDDITCTNNSLLKEITLRKNLDNENSKLNCLIADRNVKIQKVTNDNDILRCKREFILRVRKYHKQRFAIVKYFGKRYLFKSGAIRE